MQPYVGQLLLVPYDFAPLGFQLCQGQIIAISQNTALFSILGTYYGGNGTSTFGLPDLRGRSPISSGQSPGGSQYSLGENGGDETVTLNTNTVPPHTHSISVYSSDADATSPANAVLATDPKLFAPANATLDQTLSASAVAPFPGGGVPHQNLMPYLTLNWIIALSGIFPQRP